MWDKSRARARRWRSPEERRLTGQVSTEASNPRSARKSGESSGKCAPTYWAHHRLSAGKSPTFFRQSGAKNEDWAFWVQIDFASMGDEVGHGFEKHRLAGSGRAGDRRADARLQVHARTG